MKAMRRWEKKKKKPINPKGGKGKKKNNK